MHTALALLLALLLDHLLGEPRRGHPLVAFGALAERVEARLRQAVSKPRELRWRGVLGVLLLVLPPALLADWLVEAAAAQWSLLGWVLPALLVYLAIGRRSLREHARAVSTALRRADLPGARAAVGRLVSRDSAEMDASDVSRATVESTLENGCDALFGVLFWFLVAGVPGVVIYRLVNTLDAMWGYRTPRYADFGWAAARCDDLLNWPAARLTALSYALAGDTVISLLCWRRQGLDWESPNAGPVMSAGAGALGIRVGGAARYHGELKQRPELGYGASAQPADVDRALRLIERSLGLWLLFGLGLALLLG